MRRIPVVLLWHMHQPQYRDAFTGEYVLPWTYLHAIKDYSDMAAHLEDNNLARAVVNFSPVLIEQLHEYSALLARHLREAAHIPDAVLASLTEEPLPTAGAQRLQLMHALLRAQAERMIKRWAPYVDLVDMLQPFMTVERATYVSDTMLRDLSVWYHLAWLGETVRERDPRAAMLLARQKYFTAADRRVLLELIADVIGNVLPRYRALQDAGRAEISVTPYAHPILPLLYDFGASREALPSSSLPAHHGYPGGAERAVWHMEEAIRVYRDTFGIAPRGCWPSEGAVSAATLQLIDRCGFKWAATSAGVLRGSLPEQNIAAFDQAYRVPDQLLATFFRHDAISDLIGFQYATWHGDDAAENLVQGLCVLADRYAEQPSRIILIALDGENAWEHYPNNGYHFLRGMYQRLASHPRFELTTLSAALQSGLETVPLRHITAGSWVHGTLSTWMGDAAKNAAWDLLCDAKQAFDRVIAAAKLDDCGVKAAERQLALCESSDWFWWFGDYNPADAVDSFDRLYRRQLTTLYRMLDLPVPAALELPISAGSGAAIQHGAEHGGAMRRGELAAGSAAANLHAVGGTQAS